jgi:hypothetical protein
MLLRSLSRFTATTAGLSLLLLASAGASQAQSSTARADVVIPTDADTTVATGSSTTGSNTTGSSTTGSSSSIPTTNGVPLNAVRFFCAVDNGRHTVFYQPESQSGQRYAWAVPQQMGGGWSPERRCNEISSRLESYRPDGLVEMQTGRENGYNTVCVTTDKAPACRIVFTVPTGQDPISTRDRVFQNLAIADSGQRTSGVFTLQDQNQNLLGQLNGLGKALNVDLNGILGQPSAVAPTGAATGIALKPFLSLSDGGTGQSLGQIASVPVSAAPAVVAPVEPAVVKPAVVKPTAVKKPVGKKFRRIFR